MREGDVAAGIREKGSGVPCLCSSATQTQLERPDAATYRDQLERLEVAVAAVACARERLLYAQSSCAYAVGDVDDAREFLELPEE